MEREGLGHRHGFLAPGQGDDSRYAVPVLWSIYECYDPGARVKGKERRRFSALSGTSLLWNVDYRASVLFPRRLTLADSIRPYVNHRRRELPLHVVC